jgi:molybdenum cofactor biosynthesis enzyme MoaA
MSRTELLMLYYAHRKPHGEVLDLIADRIWQRGRKGRRYGKAVATRALKRLMVRGLAEAHTVVAAGCYRVTLTHDGHAIAALIQPQEAA